MEIAIISDTHMPRSGRRLPERCITLVSRADLIVHAGDLVQLSVMRSLERYAPVVAVHGNVDDAEVRSALPAKRVLELEGWRIGLVHDSGPARGRPARLRSWFPSADAVVFGHSHMPLHDESIDGFRMFNPGSPTERRRARYRSMGLAHVRRSELKFELVALD